MTHPKIIKITSLSEYASEISKIITTEQGSVWFRGHSSATHRLTPSVLRNWIPHISWDGQKLRGDEYLVGSGYEVTGISCERMMDDFKRRALPYLQYIPKNDFEWLFLMQHHGVPTRLLDWTTNALVALYFAVANVPTNFIPPTPDYMIHDEDDEMDSNCAAIFAMNPKRINSAIHTKINDVVDVAEDFEYWKAYSRPMEIVTDKFDTNFPICITAPQISPRMRAQSGLFTVHGRDVNAIDYFTDLRPLLTKILIPFENALVIRKELPHFGISESSIYPSLESVAKDVHSSEMIRFDWERRNYLEKYKVTSKTPKKSVKDKKNPTK